MKREDAAKTAGENDAKNIVAKKNDTVYNSDNKIEVARRIEKRNQTRY